MDPSDSLGGSATDPDHPYLSEGSAAMTAIHGVEVRVSGLTQAPEWLPSI